MKTEIIKFTNLRNQNKNLQKGNLILDDLKQLCFWKNQYN